MTTPQFTWIPIYQELATALVDWEDSQPELIAFLEDLRAKEFTITPLQDKNEEGRRFLLTEIDPFTVFGVFNRGIKHESRIAILAEMKKFFGLSSDVPQDFSGIPVVNNMRSWFFSYSRNRSASDISSLWRVFHLALQNTSIDDLNFQAAFDDALQVRNVDVTLTMGLFWIRPTKFINLDTHNRSYLNISIPNEGLSAAFYADVLKQVSNYKRPFPEISYQAYKAIHQPLRLKETGPLTQYQSINQSQPSEQRMVYPITKALEDVFVTQAEFQDYIDYLSTKKAILLQGSPGVGKTFIARRLAYAFMQEKAPERVEYIQFHQSYSYDDFVRGYRPNAQGQFELQDGIFLDFCNKARADIDNDYVFIIDELNRGNLSQIFGELLVLLESDKRKADYAMPLVYRKAGEENFFIPPNVHVIGLMNTADRSLALVDYALRRRFSLFTIPPQYNSEKYRAWLTQQHMPAALIDKIISRMVALNMQIAEDPLLGENYQIGHSYFSPVKGDFSDFDANWYTQIIQYEIAPLLREYWFDNPKTASEVVKRLLA